MAISGGTFIRSGGAWVAPKYRSAGAWTGGSTGGGGTGGGGTGTKLTWAPPAGWESFPLRNVSANPGSLTTLSGSGDVRIHLPSTVTGPIKVSGYRHVVIIGGSIRAVAGASQVSGVDQRLIYCTDNTGVVHIEGVLLDGNGTSGSETDAMTINGSSTTLQVQNCRVVDLSGTQGTNHADIIQTWLGVKELRVDRLTGFSNYQGIKFELTNSFRISKVDIRRTNLRGLSGQRYLYWMDPDDIVPVSLTDFYIKPVSGRDFGQSVWPGVTNGTNPATVTGTAGSQIATWPGMDLVTGHVTEGLPPGGDFVPDGVAGLSYTSPGYL